MTHERFECSLKNYGVLGDDCELFFSITRRRLPPIYREGSGEAFVPHPDDPTWILSDASLQRVHTWFIDPKLKEQAILKWKQELAKANELQPISPPEEQDKEEAIRKFEELLRLGEGTPDHESEFRSLYPDYDIVGMFGAENVALNLWCYAFVRSKRTGQPRRLFQGDRPRVVPAWQGSRAVKERPGSDRPVGRGQGRHLRCRGTQTRQAETES